MRKSEIFEKFGKNFAKFFKISSKIFKISSNCLDIQFDTLNKYGFFDDLIHSVILCTRF